MRRDARRRRPKTGTMHDFLDELIGPSATNWLIIAVAAVVILAAMTALPAIVRRLFGRDRGPPLL